MTTRCAIAAILACAAGPAWAQEGAFRAYDQVPGVALSLGVVVALIVVAAWLLRRSPLGAFARANGPLKIVATLPLGPKERLILVETGGSRLLLGVSPAGISTLTGPSTQSDARARGEPTASAPAPGKPAARSRPPIDLRELLQDRG